VYIAALKRVLERVSKLESGDDAKEKVEPEPEFEREETGFKMRLWEKCLLCGEKLAACCACAQEPSRLRRTVGPVYV
jgi:hypothetical protein